MKSESTPLVSKSYLVVFLAAVVIMLLIRGKEWIDQGIALLTKRDLSTPPPAMTTSAAKVANAGDAAQAVAGLVEFRDWVETVEPMTLTIEEGAAGKSKGSSEEEDISPFTPEIRPPAIQGLAGRRFVFAGDRQYEMNEVIPGTSRRKPCQIVGVSHRTVWLMVLEDETPIKHVARQPFEDIYRIHFSTNGNSRLEIKRDVFLPTGWNIVNTNQLRFHLKEVWENAAHFEIRKTPAVHLLCVVLD